MVLVRNDYVGIDLKLYKIETMPEDRPETIARICIKRKEKRANE